MPTLQFSSLGIYGLAGMVFITTCESKQPCTSPMAVFGTNFHLSIINDEQQYTEQ